MAIKVKSVSEIKNQAWVEHCMKVVGGHQAELAKLDWYSYCLKVMGSESKNQDRFDKVLNALSNKDTWSKWKAATVNPKSEAILAVDLALPGTALTWDKGPAGLPLWAVLQRDEGFCNDLLNTEFAEQIQRSAWWLLANDWKPVSSLSVEEKVQAMLEASIPSEHWLRHKEELHAEADGQELPCVDLREERDNYFLTLKELVGMHPNALAAVYAEGTHYLQYGFGIGDYKILDKKRILALVALIVLCGNSKGLGQVHSYIKEGLQQALTDNFGGDVAAYVASPYF
ncbi:hypothetical protein [Massilia sp. WG5]|uniref:hypothetical protein n=1 Tax=Massilia sp. WG5 TaxID=1707785 RepID=UPI0013A54EB7|nr:hypothetical protein [Massilia sp. WG5]